MSNFCNPNNFKIRTATRHKVSRRHSSFESRSSRFRQLRSADGICCDSQTHNALYQKQPCSRDVFTTCSLSEPWPWLPELCAHLSSSRRACRPFAVPACLPACCTGELAAVSRYQSGEKRRPASLLSESPHNRRARADVLTFQMSHNRNGASEWHGTDM